MDLLNQKFGSLTVLKKAVSIKNKSNRISSSRWLCKCDCGNEIDVDTRNLKTGHTKSCGCLKNKSKNVCDMTNYEDEYCPAGAHLGEASDEKQHAAVQLLTPAWKHS